MKTTRATLAQIALKDAAQEMHAPALEELMHAVFRTTALPQHTPDLEAEYHQNTMMLRALLFRQTQVLEALLANAKQVPFHHQQSASLH